MYYIVWTHGFSVRYTESSEMDRKPVGSSDECTIIFSNCQFFAWMFCFELFFISLEMKRNYFIKWYQKHLVVIHWLQMKAAKSHILLQVVFLELTVHLYEVCIYCNIFQGWLCNFVGVVTIYSFAIVSA